MKVLIPVTLTFFAFSALAKENLYDMKRIANDSIGREMSTLESNKTCINGAKSVEAFKACKYDMQHENMEMQKEQDAVRTKRLDLKDEGSMMKKDDLMNKKGEVMDKKEELDTSY